MAVAGYTAVGDGPLSERILVRTRQGGTFIR